MTKKPQTFEAAYERLEEILQQMNGPQIALEESLKLFEEADELIRTCNSKLKNAETKVETLVKERNGQLAKDASGEPIRQPFTTVNGQ